MMSPRSCRLAFIAIAAACAFLLMTGCGVLREEGAAVDPSSSEQRTVELSALEDGPASADAEAETLRDRLKLTVSYRASLSHGIKTAPYQKYIVLHDTEGDGSPMSVIDWWEGNGNLVAAHFVVGKDGSIVQCVPLDEIAHHAGFGNAGHNDEYGTIEDGRDDMLGTQPIGLPDYGMNAWSVGIELVHSGDSTPYPEAQLEALDHLIEYIDAYYGFESAIIDHKDWRNGNSDTSSAFSAYLSNYKSARTHDGL